MRLLLKGGHICDGRTGVDGVSDLLVDQGRIAGFSDDGEQADMTIDCRERYIIPQIIDIHTHCFPGYTKLGVDKNQLGFLPDFISSDLHSRNYGKTIGGLAEIISKGLKCGLSIRNVIECVSIRPAELLEMDTRIEKGKTARLNIVSVRNGMEFQVDGLILGERIQWGKGYGQTGNQKCCR